MSANETRSDRKLNCNTSRPKMTKREEKMPDGRTIIYYDFTAVIPQNLDAEADLQPSGEP